MTALLSVNQNDTSKVALYAADSRRLGIEVAPPDINISEWDFSIEDGEGRKPTVRFGLGAIKNVGHAPVDVILEARTEGGPFQDINGFAHRVDLRKVGRTQAARDAFTKALALKDSDNSCMRTELEQMAGVPR